MARKSKKDDYSGLLAFLLLILINYWKIFLALLAVCLIFLLCKCLIEKSSKINNKNTESRKLYRSLNNENCTKNNPIMPKNHDITTKVTLVTNQNGNERATTNVFVPRKSRGRGDFYKGNESVSLSCENCTIHNSIMSKNCDVTTKATTATKKDDTKMIIDKKREITIVYVPTESGYDDNIYEGNEFVSFSYDREYLYNLYPPEEYFAIDTETTGLNPREDRIVEVSAVHFVNGKIIDSFSSLVNPNCLIPQEASDVNHITNEMLATAPAEEVVYPQFIKFIGNECFNGNVVVVAHNAEFDLAFLASTLKRLGYKGNFRYIDTLTIARGMKKKLDWNLRLGDLADFFFIFLKDNMHRAETDAIACGKILPKLYAVRRKENVCHDHNFDLAEQLLKNPDFNSELDEDERYSQGVLLDQYGRDLKYHEKFDLAFKCFDVAEKRGYYPSIIESLIIYKEQKRHYEIVQIVTDRLANYDSRIKNDFPWLIDSLIERREKAKRSIYLEIIRQAVVYGKQKDYKGEIEFLDGIIKKHLAFGVDFGYEEELRDRLAKKQKSLYNSIIKLASSYRKQKDYTSEIDMLKREIALYNSDVDYGYKDELTARLQNARWHAENISRSTLKPTPKGLRYLR